MHPAAIMVRIRDSFARIGGSVASDGGDELKVHLDQDALRRRSISGGVATFAAQAVRFIFQTASQIILAHLISPGEFGLVAMVVPLIGLVQLLNDLGLSQATIQRSDISQRELSAMFWLNVSGTLAMSLLVVLLAPVVSWFYGQPRLTAITASLSGAVILAGLSAQHMALLNRRMQFLRLASIDVAATAVSVSVGIAAAALGWGYWALVAMLAANAGTVLVLSWTLARWRPSRPRIERNIGSMVQFGGSIAAYNVFEYFTMHLDNVLVGATYGGLALGLYDRAYKLMIQPLGQVTTPFTRVAVPLLSRLQDNPDSYRQVYLQMLQAMLLILAPGIVFAIVMADTLVPFLLGSEWLPSAPIFAWLAGGALILPVSNSTYWLFVSQNRAREQMFWGCAATAAIMISFVIGLPWGPIGLARSSTICYWTIHMPILMIVATRQGPVGLRHVADALYPIFLGSLAAGVVLYCSTLLLSLPRPASLAAGLTLAYLIHTLVLTTLPAGNRILRDALSLKAMYDGSERQVRPVNVTAG